MEQTESRTERIIFVLTVVLSVVVLVALVFTTGCANAQSFEIGYGQCQHTGLTEGVWWQSQFGIEGNMRPSCEYVQWNRAVTQRAGVSIGLADLGYVKTAGLGTMNDTTEFFKTYTGEPCDPKTWRNCLAMYHSRATEYGITLGSFYKPKEWLSFEGGVFLYRSSFREEVQIVTPCPTCPERFSQNVVGYHNTPYLGVAILQGDAVLRLRVYERIVQDGTLRSAYPYDASQPPGSYQMGLTKGPTITATIGVRF